jgi:hypothetical protein
VNVRRTDRLIKLLFVLCAVAALAGCKTLASKNDVGVVVAKRAQIRSSTAVVAADLLEVTRGDKLDVLDSTTVPDSQGAGERWLLVRAQNDENTEGWIEGRNVLPQNVLDQSKQLAEQDKAIPVQATGQLRASTNLRLTPDRSGNENIILKLDSGDSFEIVGWKKVPKPKTSETSESDDSPKPGVSQQQPTGRNRRDSDAPKEPEEANELWYRVRLQPIISPAPEGWVYGKQVELTVPGDIIFYRTGREFVAWQRLDDDPNQSNAPTDKSHQDVKPGSWVILEKSSANDPKKGDEPDFDRIYVLGYDKSSQEHYTAFRSGDLKGYLPLKVEGKGESKSFSIRVQDQSGQTTEAKYSVTRDDKGTLRVSRANDSTGEKRRR